MRGSRALSQENYIAPTGKDHHCLGAQQQRESDQSSGRLRSPLYHQQVIRNIPACSVLLFPTLISRGARPGSWGWVGRGKKGKSRLHPCYLAPSSQTVISLWDSLLPSPCLAHSRHSILMFNTYASPFLSHSQLF